MKCILFVINEFNVVFALLFWVTSFVDAEVMSTDDPADPHLPMMQEQLKPSDAEAQKEEDNDAMLACWASKDSSTGGVIVLRTAAAAAACTHV